MANTGQLVKPEESNSNPQILLASDDNALIKKIQVTHGPENYEIKAEPLLRIIKLILKHSDVKIFKRAPEPEDVDVEPLNSENLGDIREHLANKINSISNEILGNCSGAQDVQETILGIFTAVSSFSWDAKGVIVLAAFAVNYGEFWFFFQNQYVNDVFKSLALLDQMPKPNEEFSKLGLKMINLTGALLALIQYICDFKDIKSEAKKLIPDAPEVLKYEAHIQTAIYWTIRSIVICQSQIINLKGTRNEYIESNDAWELFTLADRIKDLHRIKDLQGNLEQQLDLCLHRIEENRVKEVYQKLVDLFEATHVDNIEILKALVGSQDDALYNGRTKSLASANSLGKKRLLLYISGPMLSDAELLVLIEILQQKKVPYEDYDIVWLPIVDKFSPWHETELFKAAQAMSWFSLWNPSLLDTAVIRYIKNVWHFKKRSIIVTLDSKGKVVNTNAIYMMMIWGNKAFPFSGSREEELWGAESWRLELLVDSIEPPITKWIADGKLVCLYGGKDIEWIRKFTATVKSVSQNGHIPIEMVYMGIRNPEDQVSLLQQICATIAAENISQVARIYQMWWFWVRLESIWRSRVQLGMPPETDGIIQEVFMFRSFECSERGWAIFNKSDQMAKAKGDTMLQCLNEFNNWKSQAEDKGFVTALNGQIHQIHAPESCNKLDFPASTTGIPKRMLCFECGGMMEELTTFSCWGNKPAY